MTDDEANRLYDAAFCVGPLAAPSIFRALYSDEERADNAATMRALIAAPDLDTAMREIRRWGNPEANRKCVKRLRELAKVRP